MWLLILSGLLLVGFTHVEGLTITHPTATVTVEKMEELPINDKIVVLNVDGTNLGVTWSITNDDHPTLAGNTGECQGKFRIVPDPTDARQAVLESTSVLNYETNADRSVWCEIRATTGGGGGGNTDERWVHVTLRNKFDVAPTFPQATYAATCQEEQAPGSACTMTAPAPVPADTEKNYASPNGPDKLTCSISGSAMFTVDPNTCIVKMPSKIDREILTTNVYPLTLKVTDSGGNTGTASLTVTVEDINDNSPNCTPSHYYKTMAENSVPPALVATVTGCTDRDINQNSALTYTSSDPTNYFVNASGSVILIQTRDYDTIVNNVDVFYIKVMDSPTNVADRRTFSVTFSVTITGVNDNFPFWGNFTPWLNTPPNATATVPENTAPGSVLFTPNCTDLDRPNEPDSTLTYSLVTATASDGMSMKPYLYIDPVTGQVRVTSATNWDFEKRQWVDITIKCSDNGSPAKAISTTARITITDVNEFPPVFDPPSGVYVETAIDGIGNGGYIGPIKVSDPDGSKARVTCYENSNRFQLTGADGTFLNVLDWDPDKPKSHSTRQTVIIKCSDGALTSTATYDVTMELRNEHNPTINIPNPTVGPFNEGSTTVGANIATISTNDDDAGDDGVHDCAIISPVPNPFYIDNCNTVRLGTPLDYEAQTQWILKITVTDRGSNPYQRTVTGTLTVDVADADDNSPICNPLTYTATIDEDKPNNTLVTTVQCPDADTHGVTYTILDVGTPFIIHPDGRITLFTSNAANNPLDYETKTSYSLTVRSTDKANSMKTADALVQVNVVNIDEYTPTFTDKSITVSEDVSVGTKLTDMVAADADAPPFNVKSYAITSVSNGGAGKFSIDDSGDVYLISPLNYDSMGGTKQYVLNLEARDGKPLVGNGVLTIIIQDANDNSPLCSQNLFTNTLSEDAIVGAQVGGPQVSAPDADSTFNNYNVVHYTFATGNTAGYFAVGLTSGVITVANLGFNYETQTQYTLTVNAIDGAGTGPNTGTCTVQINLLDVNEFTPTFAPSVHTLTANEDTPLGSLIYYANATDNDGSSTVQYAMTAGGPTFSVDALTGKISLARPLDYETAPNSYVVKVEAFDGTGVGSKTGTLTLTVSVGDINEYTPTCAPAAITKIFPESTASGTPIVTLSCTDQDLNATQTLTYMVNRVDGSLVTTPGTGPFKFLGTVLKTNTVLNYESQTKYVIEVLVKDTGSPQRTGTTTVTLSVDPVNEHAPVINPGAASVSEAATVGTVVWNMTGSDADKGSNHGEFHYTFASGNEKGYFSIDWVTGEIKVNRPLDREEDPSITLTVKATDGGGLTGLANVVVTVTDVNDNTPVFNPSSYVLSVSEAVASQAVILDFAGKVSDADEGANAAITLNTIASGNEDGKFSLSVSGSSSVLKVAASLDANLKPSYELIINAVDNGSPALTGQVSVVINVLPTNNANPIFGGGNNPVTVPEDLAIGTIIYNASATDADKGLSGNVSYTINSGNVNGAFYINPNTGFVQVFAPLDYDGANKVYNLEILARDAGTPQKTGTVTLTVSLTDVNDNSPSFPPASNNFKPSIPENSAVDTVVTTVVVNDPDSGDNGTMDLSIVSQSHLDHGAVFKLVTTGGVHQLKLAGVPDRENGSSYDVVIMAKDRGNPSRTTLQLYRIEITDVNDNTPSFFPIQNNTEYSINEKATINAPTTPVTIATITATDPDLGLSGTAGINYALAPVSPSSQPFSIHLTTGVITTNQELDREAVSNYTFWVTAADTGSPTPLTGSLFVTVNVGDANDNAPTITSFNPNPGVISEGAAGGTVATRVIAKDPDLGKNAALQYSITGGDAGGLFGINEFGHIFLRTSNTLDRDTVPSYVLTVTVNDQGDPPDGPKSTTASVTISLGDINDNDPRFPSTSMVRNVMEGSPVGTVVGAILNATDADDGDNAALSYAISDVLVGKDHFGINTTTGQVYVKVADLDRETIAQYVLRVIAVDNGNPKRTGTTTLTVVIDDLNDNVPTFLADYSTGVSVDENVPIGYLITQINATDRDTGVNALITYTIDTTLLQGSIAATLFDLEASTGKLTAKINIDREKYDSVGFYVKAMDNGPGNRNATTYVLVTINDLNDNYPIFSRPMYNGEMAYNEERTAIDVVQVQATDRDKTGNTVRYSLDTLSNYFDIVPETGWMKRRVGALQPPNAAIFHLKAVATDSGTRPGTLSSDVSVRIDTYDPATTTVCLTFSINEVTFDSKLTAIKTALANSLRSKYPTCRVGYYKHTITTDGNSYVKGSFYAVASNTTDSFSNLGVAKDFLTSTELLAFWRMNDGGTPTNMLRSSDFATFPVILVTECEGTAASAAASLAWYQTPWGIAVISLASLLGLAGLGLSIYGIYSAIASRVPKTAPAPAPAKAAAKPLAKAPPPKAAPARAAPEPRHPAPKVQKPPKRLPNEIYYDRNVWRGTPSPTPFQQGNVETSALGTEGPNRVPTPVDVDRINF